MQNGGFRGLGFRVFGVHVAARRKAFEYYCEQCSSIFAGVPCKGI